MANSDFPYGHFHLFDQGDYRAVVESEKGVVWKVDAWLGEDVYLSHPILRSIHVNGSFVRILGDEEEL